MLERRQFVMLCGDCNIQERALYFHRGWDTASLLSLPLCRRSTVSLSACPAAGGYVGFYTGGARTLPQHGRGGRISQSVVPSIGVCLKCSPWRKGYNHFVTHTHAHTHTHTLTNKDMGSYNTIETWGRNETGCRRCGVN